VFSYIAGLGGRDITVQTLETIYRMRGLRGGMSA